MQSNFFFLFIILSNNILFSDEVFSMKKLILKILEPTLLENSLIYLGNIMIQYFNVIQHSLDYEILEKSVKFFMISESISANKQILTFIMYLTIKYPNEIINFIKNIIPLQIESFFEKIMAYLEYFDGKFSKNVAIKLLIIFFNSENPILIDIMSNYGNYHGYTIDAKMTKFNIFSDLVKFLNYEVLVEADYFNDEDIGIESEKNEYSYTIYNQNASSGSQHIDGEEDLLMLNEDLLNFSPKVKFTC